MSMTSPALHDLGVAQLAAALRAKQVSAVEAAQHFLARARDHQNLGAYVAIDEAATLAQARPAFDFVANFAVPLTQHGLFFIKQEFYSLPASFL